MDKGRADTDLVELRRTLHAIPEIGLAEHRTASLLAGLLGEMGLEVTCGIGGTGVVATLKRGNHPFCLGLRAEMDGLPMNEPRGRTYASRHPDCMHACGHDGHMTMLVGAARELARDPEFRGTVRFIFQPAEENTGGARLMIEDGLFDRFPCDMVFGLHNMPGILAGRFAGKPGPLMASIDAAEVKINGRGGHGAQPETAIDPVLIGAQIVTALQSVVSRNLNPVSPGVVTVGSFHSGTCSNIIPDQARLELSLRATDPESRKKMIQRVETLCTATARALGGSADLSWLEPGYPVLVNHQHPFDTACQVIKEIFGPEDFELLASPIMASEDFSFMLEKVPGAFLFIGNGDTASLHNSSYDFNDQIIPRGVRFYAGLARHLFSS